MLITMPPEILLQNKCLRIRENNLRKILIKFSVELSSHPVAISILPVNLDGGQFIAYIRMRPYHPTLNNQCIGNFLINRDTFSGVIFALIAAVGFSAKAILVKLAYLYHVDAITLLRCAWCFCSFLCGCCHMGEQTSCSAAQAAGLARGCCPGSAGLLPVQLSGFSGSAIYLRGPGAPDSVPLPHHDGDSVGADLQAGNRPQGYRGDGAELCGNFAGFFTRREHEPGRCCSGCSAGVRQHPVLFDLSGGAGHAIARIGATRFTAYAMVVASAASLLQFGVTHPLSALDLPLRVYELSIAMAIFSTVLPVFLLSYAIKRIGSGNSSLIGSIGPVATIALAYVFLASAFHCCRLPDHHWCWPV